MSIGTITNDALNIPGSFHYEVSPKKF